MYSSGLQVLSRGLVETERAGKIYFLGNHLPLQLTCYSLSYPQDEVNKDALGEDESTHLPIVWDKVSNKSGFF